MLAAAYTLAVLLAAGASGTFGEPGSSGDPAKDDALAIGSVAIIVVGFVAVFALWFFVFRKPTEDERSRRPPT